MIASEVAEQLGISRRTAATRIASGALGFVVRRGRMSFVRAASVAEFAAARENRIRAGEAAAKLGVCSQLVYRWIAQSKLRADRLGFGVWIHREDVEALAQARKEIA
jgi:excisionase family DNA binding protein